MEAGRLEKSTTGIKRKEEEATGRTNVDTSALDGAALSFQLHKPRRAAIIYLMPLVPRYTTIYIEWLGPGWTEGGRRRRGPTRGGRETAVCESSTPTSSSREARARAHPPVYISVYKRRNAAGLYKQFDPHRRTCTQRGIFRRFSVLTVSACLLDGPSPLCAPLFPTGPVSISNTRARGLPAFGVMLLVLLEFNCIWIMAA